MLSSMCWTGVVLLVLGATAVLSAIPGPYDRRYPDYIVDPKVSCEKEGSFPHPRNCSWYYRCVDRMHVGMYWTYYFECEPGTVFSDDLDQCVHPFLAPPPCGQVVPPPPKTDPIPCIGVNGTCQTFKICKPQKSEKNMCRELQCPLRAPALQCGPGYLYDMKDRKCALPPARETLCGAVEQVLINVTEKGKVPCSENNLIPKSDFISRIYCDTYNLCDGTTFKERKELCRNYFECFRDVNEWKIFKRHCPQDLLYSYDNRRCERTPTEAEKC
ncbi:uncharacterized protein [Cherax quadricarinatus]